jgi:hypothetical protein
VLAAGRRQRVEHAAEREPHGRRTTREAHELRIEAERFGERERSGQREPLASERNIVREFVRAT